MKNIPVALANRPGPPMAMGEHQRSAPEKAGTSHQYEIHVEWTGNQGEETRTYRSYRRDFAVSSEGKAPIAGSSDPAFRGDPARYNPEDLLVASLSSCHMLWYLHRCAASGVTVVSYPDNARGVMREAEDGSGAFSRVELQPRVRITDPAQRDTALELHHRAHAMCFIANSVNFEVVLTPEIMSEV